MSHIINHRFNQFSWAVAAVLLLPLLFTKGMFFDGLTYATIARNLEEGLGTFWAPHYTGYIHSEFYEHPPFSFGIHSIFYRLFGDQAWVDRIYPYTLYGLSILMMRRLWSLFMPAGHRAWIPQLLWTLTPGVIWVHQNNMLEAPLNTATLAVVWLLIEGTIKRNYFWSALAGVLFYIALGVKGPVGGFVIIVLPIFAVLFPEHRKASLWSGLAWMTVFSLLFSYSYLYIPDFNKFFEGYMNRQLMPTLSGLREQAGSVSDSLIVISRQFLIPVAVLLVLVFRRKARYKMRRESTFFFIIALSATVPFLFMDRQHHYYFMPAMAYWMLGFAILMEQNPWPWSIQRKKWVIRLTYANLSIWVVAIGLSIYFSKSPSRDKHVIKAMKSISADYPKSSIQVAHLPSQWKWAAIAARYEKIQLCEAPQDLYLNVRGEVAPEGFELLTEYPKAGFDIYKKATP